MSSGCKFVFKENICIGSELMDLNLLSQGQTINELQIQICGENANNLSGDVSFLSVERDFKFFF